jgi:hypothetical protein
LFNIGHCNSGLAFKSKKLLHCGTKLYVFHKRKFPKVTSEMRVSFVNETSDPRCILDLKQPGLFFQVSVEVQVAITVVVVMLVTEDTVREAWPHPAHPGMLCS